MAVSSVDPHPIVVRQGEANWWGIVDVAIHTPINAANSIDVTLQARKLDVDRKTELSVADPQVIRYEGPRLLAVMADAQGRSEKFHAKGLVAEQAFYLGIRDALYAALRADGYIPSEAS